MSRSLLIVEDNDGVASLIAEVARGVGLDSERVGSGSAALAKLSEAVPACVVLDLVLADLDGFQVANAVRDLPGGAEIPIVMVSGVFKKLPDAFAERVRPHFLPKPFDPGELGRLLGASAGPTAPRPDDGLQRGDFTNEFPGALLVRLIDDRATGLLEVASGSVRRRLVFQSGQIRTGQSNVLTENAGGLQVSRGQLAREAFDAAVAHARQHRVALHDALAATGVLTGAALAEALKEQTTQVALGLLGMTGASWTFSPVQAERHPEARRHPLELMVEFVRRTVSPAQARQLLAAEPDARVIRSGLVEREQFVLRNAWPGETVTPQLAARPTLQELVGRTREEDLPFLWALVASKLVRVEETQAAAASAPRVDPDAGRTFRPEEVEARRFIFRELARFQSLDHYQLLGVAQGTPAEECRRAYIQLARRYHADAYSGLELGSAAGALAQLFQRVNEAVETLSDEQRRAEYGIYLDRKAKGLPTDVAVILQAEAIFQRAEVLVKASKWQDALEQLERAVALNPGEPEFYAYLGYVQFRVNGKAAADDAKARIQKALQESPNLVSGYVFLGAIARETGQEKEAAKQLRQALSLDPNHELALREMRQLNRQKDKPEGSLLGKLFGR